MLLSEITKSEKKATSDKRLNRPKLRLMKAEERASHLKASLERKTPP